VLAELDGCHGQMRPADLHQEHARTHNTIVLLSPQAAFMGIDNIMDAKVQAGRKAEQAAKNASKALPADKSMYQIYSQYLAENKKDWQPGQLEATNALTCIGIQVRHCRQA
jgi:hypothetical protein